MPALSMAEELHEALVVQLINGKKDIFILDDAPVITYSDTECRISSSSFNTTYNMADIEKAVFEMAPQSTTGVEEATIEMTVDLSDPTKIVFAGLTPDEQVSLYSIDGLRIATISADPEGCAVIGLTELPKALYIINTKSKSFSIYKR